MKNWKEFKILGVSIMEERNGRTRIRIPWRWVRMGVLVGWPIAGLWVHLAYLALRAGDLDEARRILHRHHPVRDRDARRSSS